MSVKSLPAEKQAQWLKQRGWEPHPTNKNVFIDPNTRMNCFLSVAVERALADCRLAADFELNPVAPARKDDAPFPELNKA